MENKKVNSGVDTILRKKAEEKLKMLKGQESHSTEPLTMDEAIKRIHELEVQKIELEIRNEELVIAKENTEQEKEILKEIFDFATFAYLSVSKEGEILALNFAAAQMLGKEGRELTKSNLHLFLSQETLADYNLFLQKLFSTQTKQTCKVTLAHRGNIAPALGLNQRDVIIDGIMGQNGEYCYLTLTDIPERKNAGQALKESERNLHLNNEQYEAINEELLQTNHELQKTKEKAERNEIELLKVLKIAHLGSWYLDVSTNEVVWTEELYKMYGFDPKQPLPPYTEHMKLFIPESWEILSASLAKTRETGIPYELELKTKRNDDTNGWMWVRGEAVLDEDKKIIGLWGVAQDISERKQAEEKLKTSDRIFKHSLDMLCIAGFDGYFKVLNPAWTKTLGWSEEDLLSNPWIEFVHPDDRDGTKNIKTVIVDGQEIFQFENRYVCKDGSVKWLSWNSFPYPEENIMFGVARDVTANKQRELVINNFFEQPLNLNLITDFDGNINRANSAWEIVLGYKKHDITESNFFDFIHPEDIAPTLEEIKKLQKGISTLHFENRYRHKNGKYRTLAWSSISSLDEQLVYAVAIDITDLKQAQQIKHELDVSRKSAIFKQNFLANMSHEIRTPLTGVLGMIEIIEQTTLTPDQKEYLHTIKLSGENLREIINQVLDYSKIEAGKITLHPHVFEFASLPLGAMSLFKNNVKTGVKFQNSIDPKIPQWMEADNTRLSQVLNNLISNAVKFTSQGVISIQSSLVSSEPKNGQIIIKVEVTDTGPGIPEDLQTKLFIPFSQVEAIDTRNYEGTGLGLSICKQLVEMMKGEIGVISKEGKGSTFWFTFPAQIAHKSQVAIQEKDATVFSKKLRILLAEDKIVNQKVVKLMLTTMGHEISIAKNGQEAIDLYQPGRFDLILMDIQMPVMNGITATQKLKEEYQILPPIVGLSANAFEGDRQKYMALGMDEYLTKPVKADDFDGLIRKLF